MFNKGGRKVQYKKWTEIERGCTLSLVHKNLFKKKTLKKNKNFFNKKKKNSKKKNLF